MAVQMLLLRRIFKALTCPAAVWCKPVSFLLLVTSSGFAPCSNSQLTHIVCLHLHSMT